MSVIIRLQGLSWSASAMDIRNFFQGLNIPPGGVRIIGGEKGDAFIAFSTDEDARRAMMLNNTHLNDGPIQLFLSSKTEMQNTISQAKDTAAPVPQQNIPPAVTTPVLSQIPSVQQISQAFPAVGQLIDTLGLGRQPPLQMNQFQGGFHSNTQTSVTPSLSGFMNTLPITMSTGNKIGQSKNNNSKQFDPLPGEYAVGGNQTMDRMKPSQQSTYGYGGSQSQIAMQQVNPAQIQHQPYPFSSQQNFNQDSQFQPMPSMGQQPMPQQQHQPFGNEDPHRRNQQHIIPNMPLNFNQSGGIQGPHGQLKQEDSFHNKFQGQVFPPNNQQSNQAVETTSKVRYSRFSDIQDNNQKGPVSSSFSHGLGNPNISSMSNTTAEVIPATSSIKQNVNEVVLPLSNKKDEFGRNIPLKEVKASDSPSTRDQIGIISKSKDVSRRDSKDRDNTRRESKDRERSRDRSSRIDSPRDRDRRDRSRRSYEDDRRYRRDGRDRDRRRDRDDNRSDRDRYKDSKDGDRKNSPASDSSRKNRKRSLSPSSRNKNENEKKLLMDKKDGVSSGNAGISSSNASFNKPVITTSSVIGIDPTSTPQVVNRPIAPLFPIINNSKGLLGAAPTTLPTTQALIPEIKTGSAAQMPFGISEDSTFGQPQTFDYGHTTGSKPQPVFDVSNTQSNRQRAPLLKDPGTVSQNVPIDGNKPPWNSEFGSDGRSRQDDNSVQHGRFGFGRQQENEKLYGTMQPDYFQPQEESATNNSAAGQDFPPQDFDNRFGQPGQGGPPFRAGPNSRDGPLFHDKPNSRGGPPPFRDNPQGRHGPLGRGGPPNLDGTPFRDGPPGRDGPRFLEGQSGSAGAPYRDRPSGRDGSNDRNVPPFRDGPPPFHGGPHGRDDTSFRDGPPGRESQQFRDRQRGPDGPSFNASQTSRDGPSFSDGPPRRDIRSVLDGPQTPDVSSRHEVPPVRGRPLLQAPVGNDGSSFRDGPPVRDAPPYHSRTPGRDGPPFLNVPHGRDGPPFHDVTHGRDGPPFRDGQPGRVGPPFRDGPPGRDGPPFRDGPLSRDGPPFRDEPPGRDGPPFRNGPPSRDGPPFRDGPPGRDGPPFREGPPGRDGPQSRDGPPGRDGPPFRLGHPGRDGPPFRNGPPGKDGTPSRDGPPGRDGPPFRDSQPGGDGPPFRNGPPGKDSKPLRDGPPGRDGPPFRDSQPGRDGPPFREGPPGRDGPPFREGPPGRDGQPFSDGPPGRDGPPFRGGPPGGDGPRGRGGPHFHEGPPFHEMHRGRGRPPFHDGPPVQPGNREPFHERYFPGEEREGRDVHGDFNVPSSGDEQSMDNFGQITEGYDSSYDYEGFHGTGDRSQIRGPHGRNALLDHPEKKSLEPFDRKNQETNRREFEGQYNYDRASRNDGMMNKPDMHNIGRPMNNAGSSPRVLLDTPGNKEGLVSSSGADTSSSFDSRPDSRGDEQFDRSNRETRRYDPRNTNEHGIGERGQREWRGIERNDDRKINRDRSRFDQERERRPRDRDRKEMDDGKSSRRRDRDEDDKNHRRSERDRSRSLDRSNKVSNEGKNDEKVNKSSSASGNETESLKSEREQSSLAIVLQKIPKDTTYKDIRRLFASLESLKDGIKIINDNEGHRIGKAYVKFSSYESFKRALTKDKSRMGGRTIEIRPVSKTEYDSAVDSFIPTNEEDGNYSNDLDVCNSLSATLSRLKGETIQSSKPASIPKSFVVKVNSLPVNTKKSQLRKFFEGCNIAQNGEAIVLETKDNKNFTGLCYIEFADEKSFKHALKHRKVFDRTTINIMAGNKKDMEEVKRKVGDFSNENESSIKLETKDSRDKNVATVNPSKSDNTRASIASSKLVIDPNKVYLWLKNLPPMIRVVDVRSLFEGTGSIRTVQVCHDAVGKPTGECCVEFLSADDAHKGLDKNGTMIGTYKVSINAVTKPEMVEKMRLSRLAVNPEVPTTQAVFYFVKAANLPKVVNTGEIIKFFSGFNPAPESIRLNIGDDATSDCSTALVGFLNREDAEAAISSNNGKQMRSKSVALSKVVL